jgi:hypothetical protein
MTAISANVGIKREEKRGRKKKKKKHAQNLYYKTIKREGGEIIRIVAKPKRRKRRKKGGKMYKLTQPKLRSQIAQTHKNQTRNKNTIKYHKKLYKINKTQR